MIDRPKSHESLPGGNTWRSLLTYRPSGVTLLALKELEEVRSVEHLKKTVGYQTRKDRA